MEDIPLSTALYHSRYDLVDQCSLWKIELSVKMDDTFDFQEEVIMIVIGTVYSSSK